MSIFDFSPQEENQLSESSRLSHSAEGQKTDSKPKNPAAPQISSALKLEKLKQLDAAVDSIRHKYGSNAIVRGSFLDAPDEYRPKASRKKT